MRERDKTLTIEQKALSLNLDPYKYGTIVEIGAGQEAARQFFRVGAAAGTIAKTMSAYDMQVSDSIYGQVGRYVSRERLLQMLDKEFTLLVDRLSDSRPRTTTFFAYAATVAAKSYQRDHECHGWIGVRLQLHPGAAPSDIILHVRMLDNENSAQSEALGLLGVNLIYGAFHYWSQPTDLIDGLKDSLGPDQIEIDLIHFGGSYFEETENRLMNLHLINSWQTRAVIFNPQGEVVVPGELFYKKPVLVIRGSFNPVTKVNVDMMDSGKQQFVQENTVDADRLVTLAEITMNSLVTGGAVDTEDFLARVDLLASLGHTVMISDYVRFFRLRAYLRRYTQKQIGIVLSVRDFNYLFDLKFYEGLEGGILEAFGKLFPDNTSVYVYPSRRANETELTTLETVTVPPNLTHLLAHLIENKLLVPFQNYDESLLHIDMSEVHSDLRRGRGEWEQGVPEIVAEQIIERRLLGFDSE